jgi:putative ABC transport system substrate-binding protein
MALLAVCASSRWICPFTNSPTSNLATLAERPNGSAFFLPDLTVNALRSQVISAVERHRLPAIYSEAIFVRSGGLASYGADRIELFRRAAGYVDRILRGENPAELSFQQPTKYELLINLRSARALALEVPPTLLVVADEVIE